MLGKKRGIAVLLTAALLISSTAAFGAPRFLFGVQTYMARLEDWTDTWRGAPGLTLGDNRAVLINLIRDLGVSLVRDGSQLDNLLDGGGELQLATMRKILGTLQPLGVVLDWVIVSTPSQAVDRSAKIIAPRAPNPYSRPPLISLWTQALTEGAKLMTQYGVPGIIEQWNEPDLKDIFWSGTLERYFEMYDAGAQAIRRAAPGVAIMNGGLVADRSDNGKWYSACKQRLSTGMMDYMALHLHGDLDALHNALKNRISKTGIPYGQIILNEAGYPWKDGKQARNVPGKAIWCIGNGLAGYVAFHMGAIGTRANPDLAEGDLARKDYALVTEGLELKPAYVAYKTVISLLDGAVIQKKLHEGSGRYEYLFIRDDGMKVYAAIGGKAKPQEVRKALGTANYLTFDMMGEENGPAKDIQYFIAG